MLYNPVIFTHSRIPLPLACLPMGQEVVGDLSLGQLAAPEFTESRKLRGLCPLTLPFYREEAGRLFVLNPRILCGYLAFTPFPLIMAEQVMR